LAWRVSQRASRERYFSKPGSPYQGSDQALAAHTRSRGAIFDPFTSRVDEVLNRHSPDPGGFEARIAPLNGLGNRKSRSLRAKGDRSGRLAARKRCARRTSGRAVISADGNYGLTSFPHPSTAPPFMAAVRYSLALLPRRMSGGVLHPPS
jgi:hypothetical protein